MTPCASRKVLIILACLLLYSYVVAGQVIPTEPEGPTTMTIDATARRTPVEASSIAAIAGNVTQLTISGNTITQTWQAFYGNVSGTVTLDDASNRTIYDWTVASPEGEMYVSESTVDFTDGNIFCYDFNDTDVGKADFNTLAEYEVLLGLETDDPDGIDETFIEALNYDSFYVGSTFLDNSSDLCPTTQMYDQDESSDTSRFQEVLLYDNTSNKLVYTALLEQDALGFDTNTWDFELIVGEDGHDGDTATTTFYFYVELE